MNLYPLTYHATRNQLLTEIASRNAEIAELRAEITELRATIIEADSAFNLDGHVSTWEETTSLVRMCHKGRSALDKNARDAVHFRRLKAILANGRTVGASSADAALKAENYLHDNHLV